MAKKSERLRLRWQQQGKRCLWCGTKTWHTGQAPKKQLMRAFGLEPGEYGSTKAFRRRRATLEHILPKSLGGTDALRNLAMACQECNTKRSSNLHKYRPQTHVACGLPKAVQETLRFHYPEPEGNIPMLKQGDQTNFGTLQTAMKEGQVALVESRCTRSGEYRALICAMNFDGNDMMPVPLAQMVPGNPYEDYLDPTRDDLPEAKPAAEPLDPNQERLLQADPLSLGETIWNAVTASAGPNLEDMGSGLQNVLLQLRDSRERDLADQLLIALTGSGLDSLADQLGV